ncbi:hypothetical protein Tco_1125918 [Tanacetum coccineum]
MSSSACFWSFSFLNLRVSWLESFSEGNDFVMIICGMFKTFTDVTCGIVLKKTQYDVESCSCLICIQHDHKFCDQFFHTFYKTELLHFGESVEVGYFLKEFVLAFEAEALPLVGAEGVSLMVIPFKASVLDVDFDFKIDLIVFGPETVAEESVTPTGESVVLICVLAMRIFSVSWFGRIDPSASDSQVRSTPGVDTFVSSTEDFTNNSSKCTELEGSSIVLQLYSS